MPTLCRGPSLPETRVIHQGRCAVKLTEPYSNKQSALQIHMGLLRSCQLMDCQILPRTHWCFVHHGFLCSFVFLKILYSNTLGYWLFWYPLRFSTKNVVPIPDFSLELQKASYLNKGLASHCSRAALHHLYEWLTVIAKRFSRSWNWQNSVMIRSSYKYIILFINFLSFILSLPELRFNLYFFWLVK